MHKMARHLSKAQGIVIAGVGGQGAITLAQLILGAARYCGYYALQSEVHGMSQRGGAVNAQIIFDTMPVTSPIILDGAADLLIGLEPLEALRNLPMMAQNAPVVVSQTPVINMPYYPPLEDILQALNKVQGITILDTDHIAKTLNNPHAGGMALLGSASSHMPIPQEVWPEVIAQYFSNKGDKIIQKNKEAFLYGYGQKNGP
jgi:indolepyruvate ferredoxin oxidoreductase, beta subunit